jgi:hypothetical protein
VRGNPRISSVICAKHADVGAAHLEERADLMPFVGTHHRLS